MSTRDTEGSAGEIRGDGLDVRRMTSSEDRARAQLARRERELDEVNYAISHDLGAPLRAVLGYADVLVEEYQAAIGPDAAQYVERIARNARRLESLVNGLDEFTRLARADVHPVRLDVTELVRELIEGLRRQGAAENATWAVAEAMTAVADRHLLRRALGALLHNAVKFATPGVAPVVDVRLVSGGPGQVVIRISDNGVGFDAATVQSGGKGFRLFKRFHAASQFQGVGVGLATARMIADNHGGRLWCESTPDHGATFFLALPE